MEKMNILLIGGNYEASKVMHKALSSMNFNIKIAYNHASAISIFSKGNIDAAIIASDVFDEDSLDIAKKIRITEKALNIPWTTVIISTNEQDVRSTFISAVNAEIDDAISCHEDISVLQAKMTAISRVVKIRNQLNSSQETLEQILMSVEEGIHVVALDGTVMVENAASLEMLGYSNIDGLVGSHAHGAIHHHHADGSNFPEEECPIYATLTDGRVRHVVDDVFWRHDNTCFPVEYRCAPLCDSSGKIYGSTIIFHDVTERRKAEERIHRMAQYDGLTDLPNRMLVADRLKHTIELCAREKCQMAILYIDIDKFKPVNDTYGHAIGDQLLRLIALRLKQCIRKSDTVGRLGGDEFVALLPRIHNETDAIQVAEKIRTCIERDFEIEENVINVSTSIGISIYPDHSESEQELQVFADQAMYKSKQNGGNCISLFGEEIL